VNLPGVSIPVPRLAYPGGEEERLGVDLGEWPIDADPTWSEVLDVGGYLDVGAEYLEQLVPDLWPF
jgi:hypothetical protein